MINLSYSKYKKVHPYLRHKMNKKKKKKKKASSSSKTKKETPDKGASFEEETIKFIGELEAAQKPKQTPGSPISKGKKKHIRVESKDTTSSRTTAMTTDSQGQSVNIDNIDTQSDIVELMDKSQDVDDSVEVASLPSKKRSRSQKTKRKSKKRHSLNHSNSIFDLQETPTSVETVENVEFRTTNVFKKGKSNILVAVRVRPMMKKEKEINLKNIIKIMNNKMVVVLDLFSKDDVLRANRSREKKYAFDHAFDDTIQQSTVYTNTVKHLIGGVMNGYNATVFAYGATGSGKTHTMLGTDTEPGIMFLALNDIFAHIDQHKESTKYSVELSYLEVYNECIRDLLQPTDDYLELREDSTQGIHVVGITKKKVKSVKAIMQLLRTGNRNRTQEPTAANKTSSRSHAVLQVWVRHRERSANTREEYTLGKLSLIDLAGSERASVTQNKGIRLLEGANINRSLLALGNCINALRKGSRGGYIPFRDSKLTRLLKDSLGGNCRTVMITAISPGHLTHEDTLNTLKYADRAKHIKTNVTKNTYAVNQHIVHYTKIIEELRSEITNLKQKLIHKRKAAKEASSQQSTPSSPTKGDIDAILFDDYKHKLEMNFEELLQAKTSLYELEELQMSNKIRCHELHLEISRGSTAGYSESKLKRLKRELSSLSQSIRRNEKMKSNFRKKVLELEKNALVVKEKLKLITRNFPAYQDLLSQLLKLHVLELQNTELLAYQNKQQDMLRAKDLELQKVKMQLELRDSLIKKQSTIIMNNSLNFDQPTEFGSLLEIEEIFSDEQVDVPASPEQQDVTPPPINRGNPVFKKRIFEDAVTTPPSSSSGNQTPVKQSRRRASKLQKRRMVRQQRLNSIYGGSNSKPKQKSRPSKSPPPRSTSPPMFIEDMEASDKLHAARIARAQRRESAALRSDALEALKNEWNLRNGSISSSYDNPQSLPLLRNESNASLLRET